MDRQTPTTNRAPGRIYGGQTAQERRQERRERLLEAALELFARRGYANTTIEALCKATGLNPRYFYEHFRSREELLRAIYERIGADVGAAVVAAVDAAPVELRARIEAGVRAYARTMLADERYPQISYVEVVGVSPKLERRRLQAIRANAALLEEQAKLVAKAGGLPDRDFRRTTVALMGASDALVLDWLSERPRPPVEAIVEELIELYVAALSRSV